MKILITGLKSSHFAKQTYAESNTGVQSLDSIGLKLAFQRLGYKVEARAVTPGEDLSKYDCCVVFMAALNSLGSRYSYGMLWTLMSHNNCFVTFDDYSPLPSVYTSIRMWASRPEEMWRQTIKKSGLSLNKVGFEEAHAMRHRYETFLKTLNSQQWPWPILIKQHGWGDPRHLMVPTKKGYYPFDMSPLYERVGYNNLNLNVPARQRKRRWILGTLTKTWHGWNKISIDDLTWEVKRYGHDGHPKLSLEQTILETANSWGAIATDRPCPGAGFVRLVWHHCALSRTIVLTSPAEAKHLGLPFRQVARDPLAVERMDNEELTALAEQQAAWVLERTTSYDETVERLARIIRREVKPLQAWLKLTF